MHGETNAVFNKNFDLKLGVLGTAIAFGSLAGLWFSEGALEVTSLYFVATLVGVIIQIAAFFLGFGDRS